MAFPHIMEDWKCFLPSIPSSAFKNENKDGCHALMKQMVTLGKSFLLSEFGTMFRNIAKNDPVLYCTRTCLTEHL